MKNARQYIYAFLVAALLFIQLAQAAHYRVHFQEPEYVGHAAQLLAQSSAGDHHKSATPKSGDHAGPDECDLCFYMKYLGFGLIVVAAALLLRRFWQPVGFYKAHHFAALAASAYSARASPAAA